MAEIDFGALWDSSKEDASIPVSSQVEVDPKASDADIISQNGASFGVGADPRNVEVQDYTQGADQLREQGAQEADITIARMEMEGKTPDEIALQVRSDGSASPIVPDSTPVQAEPVSSQIEKIKRNAPDITDQQIIEYFDDNNLGQEAKDILGIKASGGQDPLNLAVRVAGSKDDDTVARTTITDKSLGFVKDVMSYVTPVGMIKGLLEDYKNTTDDVKKFSKIQEIKASVDQSNLTSLDRLVGEGVGAYDQRLLQEHKIRVRNANQITTELVGTLGYKVRYDEEGNGKGQVQMQDGSWKTMDTTMLQEIKASKFAELGLIAGGEFARRAIKGKGSGGVRAVVAGAGGIVSAGIASGAGDVIDIAISSMVTGQKFEKAYYAKRAVQTAKLGIVLESLGIVAVGGVIGGARLAGKGVDNLQSKKIKRHLADAFDYTPESAEILVKEVEAKGITLGGDTTLDKYISHMAKSHKQFNEVASNALADLGAKDANTVLKQVGELSRVAVSQMQDISKLGLTDVKEGWERYRKLVHKGYSGVKQYGDFIAPDFRFVADDNLVPKMNAILDDLSGGVSHQADKFRDIRRVIESSMQAGSVSDSMDIVRELNKTSKLTNDKRILKVVADLKLEVQGQMYRGIEKHAESPEIAKQFIADYKTSNAQWSKMKDREKQVLGKLLTADAFSSKAVLATLNKYSDSPELIQETLGGMPKKFAHAIEKAYFDNLMSKNGMFNYSGDVTNPNTNVAKANEVAIDFKKISSKMKQFDTRVLSPQGKRLMKTMEVFGDVADNLQTGISRSDPRFILGEAGQVGDTIRDNPRSIAKNKFIRKVVTSTVRFLPFLQDGRIMALRHRTAKLLINPLDANNLKAMRGDFPKQDLESFDIAVQELQQAYKLDSAGKIDPDATMLYLRNKSQPQLTKYGRGRVSNVSIKATLDSYPILASNVLDATSMPKAELDALLKHPSSAKDRGIHHILRDGKMFGITERVEELRRSDTANPNKLAEHSTKSDATNDMQSLRNVIKIKGSSLTPEENTNFWAYLGDNPKASKDDVVQWAEVNLTSSGELPTALKPK